MAKQYTKEQYGELFDQLPEELQEAIFSLETSENIYSICKTYGLIKEESGEIAECVGQVLMGVLPPSEFQGIIQEKAEIPEVLARVVSQEINRFIFYPVRPALEELYKIEITPSAKPSKVAPPPSKEEPKAPPRKDVYRELIE